uniref:Solute carrier family 9 member A9 n=1 Tax=Xiphophorus couchianus TaxID=32473 RepID=A0A3B5LW03_9TELE
MVLLRQAADGEFSLTDCLLFGAIMSATDPVSVLGLLSDLRVDSDLHALLFGESVLNDAVAIVLTHAITSYDQMETGNVFQTPAFFRSVGFFVGVLIGSFLLGFIFTVITNPLLETSIFFLLSWSSFLSAEACGLSGIVAVLFCGLSQAKYTSLNLSHEGSTRTKQLFEVLNFLGEIFIFGYMGYIWFTFRHHAFRALFISGAFLSIFISRACNIYPLSFLINLGRTKKVSRNFQNFMVFTGLRGAVSFSLAVRDTSTEARRTILTTTLLLIGFTVWVLGAAADPLLGHLDLRSVFAGYLKSGSGVGYLNVPLAEKFWKKNNYSMEKNWTKVHLTCINVHVLINSFLIITPQGYKNKSPKDNFRFILNTNLAKYYFSSK